MVLDGPESGLKLKELHPSLLKRVEKYVEELHGLERMLSDGGSFNDTNQKLYAKVSYIKDIRDRYLEQLESLKELQEIIDEDPSLGMMLSRNTKNWFQN